MSPNVRPYPLILPLAVLVAVGCKPSPPAYAPPPPAVVTVAPPQAEEVANYLTFTGTLAGVESVELRARVKGFLEKVHYRPGVIVSVGDLLFTIDPRTFRAAEAQAAAELAAAEARLKEAEFDHRRMAELRERNVAAELESVQKQAEFEGARAAVALRKAALESAQLELDFTEVRAPIAGRVSRNLVDPGALVGAGEPTLLATVINDEKMYAYFDMSEGDLLRIMRQRGPRPRTGAPPDIEVELGRAEDEGFPFRGRFDYADNRVDPETGTIRLRALFDNPRGELVAGLFVRMRAVLSRERALLVPEVAVGSDQAGRYVLVVNQDDAVERRTVRVGASYDQRRRIEDGLEEADRVVINGIQRARPGAKVVPQAAAAPPSAAPAAAVAAPPTH